jgi:hypothetical protein
MKWNEMLRDKLKEKNKLQKKIKKWGPKLDKKTNEIRC